MKCSYKGCKNKAVVKYPKHKMLFCHNHAVEFLKTSSDVNVLPLIEEKVKQKA